MASLNKVMLIGNLGRDPESRVLQSGMATNFSIATTRRYRSGSGEVVSETEWHNISMFGKLAEIAAQYLKKGSAVYIEGRIRSRKYQSKDGTEKTASSPTRCRCSLAATMKARPRSPPHSDALLSRHATLTYPSDLFDNAVKLISHSIFSNNSSPRHCRGLFRWLT